MESNGIIKRSIVGGIVGLIIGIIIGATGRAGGLFALAFGGIVGFIIGIEIGIRIPIKLIGSIIGVIIGVIIAFFCGGISLFIQDALYWNGAGIAGNAAVYTGIGAVIAATGIINRENIGDFIGAIIDTITRR
jgi:hypothetical protein